MLKKIIILVFFTCFACFNTVFAAESGGMPQLNPEFWISQIFWLIITFGILFIVLTKVILPKISNNRLLLIFGNITLVRTIKSIPNVMISQNIWDIQNSGLSWGIPPLSAANTVLKHAKHVKNTKIIIFFNIN